MFTERINYFLKKKPEIEKEMEMYLRLTEKKFKSSTYEVFNLKIKHLDNKNM